MEEKEIEVTQEMIDAGVKALEAYGFLDMTARLIVESAVVEAYCAMSMAQGCSS